MAEYVVNTSPIQYLHQIGQLDLLPTLLNHVLVPPAVATELAAGRAIGVDLPDLAAHGWLTIRAPSGGSPVPDTITLGPGETEVIALTMECGDAVAVLDDRVARQFALSLGLRITGTLGLLLDAKQAGMLPSMTVAVDRLERHGFRISNATRATVLRLAGEQS